MANHTKPALRPMLWCGAAVCLVGIFVAYRHADTKKAERTAAFSGSTMGTYYTVKVVSVPTGGDLDALERGIFEKLSRIDNLMSTYVQDSEISQFNRFDQTDWFPVSQETARVVEQALEIGRTTGGAFDITAGPLVDLWNFGPRESHEDQVPKSAALDPAKHRVGLDGLEVRISPPALRKTSPDVSVDLSGIAKGFAVDAVAEHLDRLQISNYLVDVGGELKGKGRNGQGQAWQIAIEAPVPGSRTIHRIVPVHCSAVATSGDYRNYFEADGVRYSHIIDPRSGYPVSHSLASVTLLDPSCARADALATGLMVLGPDEGFALAMELKLPVLLLVKSDGGFVEKSTPYFTSDPLLRLNTSRL
jgi:thiamine biosynthesis lipoprotein